MATWGEQAADAFELEFNVVSKIGRINNMSSEQETVVYGNEGDYWRFTLHDNPSTGFRWEIRTDGPVEVV